MTRLDRIWRFMDRVFLDWLLNPLPRVPVKAAADADLGCLQRPRFEGTPMRA